MNNSIYGKTCENLTRRTDIKLVTEEDKLRRFLEKPHLLNFRIFSEQMAGIEMRKLKVHINRPTYAGFVILEQAKLCMYKFHYDVFKPKFPDSKLLFTDTDSMYYSVKTHDFYKKMFEIRDHLDLSEYPETSEFYDPTNKRIIGKFKDETQGAPILEFVGLRPKMYSYQVLHGTPANPEVCHKHRAKGICKAASATLRHEDYKAQIENPTENYLVNRRIAIKLHQIYSLEAYTFIKLYIQ